MQSGAGRSAARTRFCVYFYCGREGEALSNFTLRKNQHVVPITADQPQHIVFTEINRGLIFARVWHGRNDDGQGSDIAVYLFVPSPD